MSIRTRGFLLVVTIAVLSLPLESARAAPDAGDGEWNQYGGSAFRDSVAAVEPIRTDPKIAWKITPPGELLSNLVSWGGTVYYVTKDKSRRRLHAVRAIDGDVQATKVLSKGGPVDLAVWQGTVILREKGTLTVFPHRISSLSAGWKKRGKWEGRPLVYAGRILLCDDKKLHLLDVKRGKSLASAYRIDGHLALGEAGGRWLVAGAGVVRYEGDDEEEAMAQVITVRIQDLDGRKPEFGDRKPISGGILGVAPHRLGKDPLDLFRINGKNGCWIVLSPDGFKGADGGTEPGAIAADSGDGGLFPLRTAPAVFQEIMLGFDRGGSLTAVSSQGRSAEIVAAAKLPAGARPGPATGCKGAIVFGNWAVDTESGRVLWCLEDLESVGPAIPAGDGVLVVTTKGGDIVGLVDPVKLAARESATADGDDTPARPPVEPNLVILADGRRFTGKAVRQKDGKYRIEPKKGKPLVVAADEIVIALSEGKVVCSREEHEVYDLWRDALDDGLIEDIEPLFEGYMRTGLIGDCRRLIEEAERYGLLGHRKEKWTRKLAGRPERVSKQVQRNLLKKEEGVRGGCWQKCVDASNWCRDHGFASAAAALLDDADRIQPGRAEIEAAAKALVPEGFPFKGFSDTGRRWAKWAAAILPAGAEFLAPGDDAWDRVSAAPWDKGTIGFRTRNLLMFSRSKDIDAVGRCLRTGEATVRVLDTLLSDGKRIEVDDDSDRLEVRIHATREDFIAEDPGDTEHLAGYYSPSEHVSRFFVPREAESGELMSQSLFQVLAHEMTHQYIEETWLGGETSDSGATPGFWVVEGLARFVEDQSVEMGRRGLRFDDPTVSSIDCAARLAEKHALFPVRKLLAMDQMAFARLGDDPVVTIELRNTIASYPMSQSLIFYEQAGSLVFFLMNRAGPEARKALIRYMRDHYKDRLRPPRGKLLAHESIEALDKAYRAFLKGQ